MGLIKHQKISFHGPAPKSNFILQTTFNILLVFSFLFIIFFNLLWTFRDNNLKDFGSFIASGQAANSGQNPYLVDSPYTFVVTFEPLNLTVPSYNLNPPISVPLFQLLSILDPLVSYRIWQGFSFLCFIVLVFLLWKKYDPHPKLIKILWVFCLGGLWHIIELGQIYLPFLLLFGIAFYLIDNPKYEWITGLLLGICISIKPNFIILVLYLLLKKKFRLSIYAITSATVISIIPIFFYGFKIYFQWMQAISSYNGYAIPGNNSTLGLLTRFGWQQYNLIITSLIILLVGLSIYKHQYDLQITGFLAVLVTLFTSPVAWPGYTTFLVPFIYKEKWNWITVISACILIVPAFIIFDYYDQSNLHLIILGWLYGWALVLLLINQLVTGNSHDNLIKKNQ